MSADAVTARPITVLVADDEPLARRRLLRLLRAEPGIEVVAECKGGRSAVEQILARAPDLVFLDIQMPDLDGFGVIAEVGPERMPAVVFVTAYDQYALRAFEVHAFDYLLKPFEGERFHGALARVRAYLSATRAEGYPGEEQLRRLLAEVIGREADAPARPRVALLRARRGEERRRHADPADRRRRLVRDRRQLRARARREEHVPDPAARPIGSRRSWTRRASRGSTGGSS